MGCNCCILVPFGISYEIINIMNSCKYFFVEYLHEGIGLNNHPISIKPNT